MCESHFFIHLITGAAHSQADNRYNIAKTLADEFYIVCEGLTAFKCCWTPVLDAHRFAS